MGAPDVPEVEPIPGIEARTPDIPRPIPVPMLMPAATDGRLFARLGTQTYGFLPMLLPSTLDFAAVIHGPNERVPVDAINFGANAIYRLLQLYGRTP